MPLETRPFDPVLYLDGEEAVVAYLNEALGTGDAAFVADALGVVARTRGMAGVAERAGLSRESLYRSLSAGGNPEFATVLRVLGALGLRLEALAALARPRGPGPPVAAPVPASPRASGIDTGGRVPVEQWRGRPDAERPRGRARLLPARTGGAAVPRAPVPLRGLGPTGPARPPGGASGQGSARAARLAGRRHDPVGHCHVVW
jgi:probable addiction module antidote protein